MRNQSIKEKLNGFWKVMFLGMVALFLLIAPVSMLVEVSADGSSVILVRRANLVSPTGSVNPHGEAEYELYQSGNRELEVEIEDVNLPAGTSLTAVIDGNAAIAMRAA